MSELRVPWARRYGRDVVFDQRWRLTRHEARLALVLLVMLIVGLWGVANGVFSTDSNASTRDADAATLPVEIGDAQVLYAPSNGHDGAPLMLVSGKSLFPFGPGHLLNQDLDAPVMGQGVKVLEVAGTSGLWVGMTPEQRVYVNVPSAVIAFGSIDPKILRVGEEVNLSGRMRPIPEDIAALGLTDATGGQQLVAQGALVEANSLSVAR